MCTHQQLQVKLVGSDDGQWVIPRSNVRFDTTLLLDKMEPLQELATEYREISSFSFQIPVSKIEVLKNTVQSSNCIINHKLDHFQSNLQYNFVRSSPNMNLAMPS